MRRYFSFAIFCFIFVNTTNAVPPNFIKQQRSLPIVFRVNPYNVENPEPLSYSSAEESEIKPKDEPNFGRLCDPADGPHNSCGNYFDSITGIDHTLFCSKEGICAGWGSMCISSEACGEGE